MNLSTSTLIKTLKHSTATQVEMDDETLRRYQLYLLSMMEDIIAICDTQRLHYQLSGGSALGAVRHGGFIPWDDDMDLNMFDSEFKQFADAFKAQYGEKYSLQTWKTPGNATALARVRLKESVMRTQESFDSDDENGFPVDIFLFVNVPNNPVLRAIHGFLCLSAGFLLSCRNIYKNRAFMRELEKENPEVKASFEFKIAIGWLLAWMSPERCATITHSIYALCKNNNSKYISIPSGRGHYFGEMYLREDMENTVKMPFEGHEWNVARNYDAYFKALYGPDYMTPPPPEKREKHVVLELKFPETSA